MIAKKFPLLRRFTFHPSVLRKLPEKLNFHCEICQKLDSGQTQVSTAGVRFLFEAAPATERLSRLITMNLWASNVTFIMPHHLSLRG